MINVKNVLEDRFITTQHQEFFDVDENQSVELLKGKDPYTFLVRLEKKTNQMMLSCITDKSEIFHKEIVLKDGYLHYYNAVSKSAKTIEELISLIFRCSPSDCKPLKKDICSL